MINQRAWGTSMAMEIRIYPIFIIFVVDTFLGCWDRPIAAFTTWEDDETLCASSKFKKMSTVPSVSNQKHIQIPINCSESKIIMISIDFCSQNLICPPYLFGGIHIHMPWSQLWKMTHEREWSSLHFYRG